MVMVDEPKAPRYVLLKRGAYDAPGEKVTPGMPRILPSCARNGRTTAWVWRSGWWIRAKSADGARHGEPVLAVILRHWPREDRRDFGSQGEWPVHPELLDWLAVEFMDTGWNVKAHAEDDRDERDLPAIVEGDSGAIAEGPGKPFAGARTALPSSAGR